MRGLSGNIVCGAVLVLSLFLFSSLGLELVLVGARDAHLARSPSGLWALEAGRLVWRGDAWRSCASCTQRQISMVWFDALGHGLAP